MIHNGQSAPFDGSIKGIYNDQLNHQYCYTSGELNLVMFDEWEQDFDLTGFKQQKMRFSYWGEIQII